MPTECDQQIWGKAVDFVPVFFLQFTRKCDSEKNIEIGQHLVSTVNRKKCIFMAHSIHVRVHSVNTKWTYTTVWVKKPPDDLYSNFSKTVENFSTKFYVPIRLRIFIQLSATFTKLCHIKRDHPVHIMCAKCPPSAETHAGIFWHFIRGTDKTPLQQNPPHATKPWSN